MVSSLSYCVALSRTRTLQSLLWMVILLSKPESFLVMPHNNCSNSILVVYVQPVWRGYGLWGSMALWEGTTPLPCGRTNKCKNITFPQLRYFGSFRCRTCVQISFVACAFWMMFGGDRVPEDDEGKPDASNYTITVDGMNNPNALLFTMFRLTLVDDYDYDVSNMSISVNWKMV